LNSPVVICYGNPGYDDQDKAAAQDPIIWNRLAQQRSGTEPYPVWLPGWKDWLAQRTKQIGLPMEALSNTVATFNVVPYASVEMTDGDVALAASLPSVAVARRYLHEVLVPKATAGKVFLVVIRKHELWQVERVTECRTLRLPRNLYRGGALGALGREVRAWLDEGHHAASERSGG
jgi:hypothetical protein